jgi:hypothetical protein
MSRLTQISKFILSIVAMQILNLSIYAQFDPVQSGNTMGNLNSIDSVTEYVAEIMLHHTNAFPEFEKNGAHKDQHQHKNYSIHLFNDFKKPATGYNDALNKNNNGAVIKDYRYLFFKEINPPPPKA